MTTRPEEVARAQAMLSVGRPAEAAAVLSRLVASNPGNGRLFCMLASAQLGLRQNEQALDSARQAVALLPESDWAHRLVSLALVRLSQPEAAEQAARQAVRLAPGNWQSYSSLAQAKLAQTDSKGAAEAAAEARRLAPGEASVYVLSGRAALAAGNRREARTYQEQALAINPAHSEAMNELGRIASRWPVSPSAVRHFLQAARATPGDGAYGRNIEITVRNSIGKIIYFASFATYLLLLLAMLGASHRMDTVAGLAAVAVISPLLAAWQLSRMPREVRPLFRRRLVVLALLLAYAPIVVALVVVAAIPAADSTGVLLGMAALLLAARFCAVALLRRAR